MQFVVEWLIEIDADTPVEAAQEALRIMRDPDSLATVMVVFDEDGTRRQIDLTAVENDEACRKCGVHEDSPDYGTVGDGYDGLCPSCADAEEPE